MNFSKEQLDMMTKYESARMNDMDAYIGIRAGNNIAETSDVPSENMSLYNKYFADRKFAGSEGRTENRA